MSPANHCSISSLCVTPAFRRSTLPDVIVGNTLYMLYLSFYRHLLVDTLIRDADDIQSIGEQAYS